MLKALLTEIDIFFNHRLCGYRSDEWAPFDAITPRKLVDGTVARGPIMRRYIDGNWECRQETDDEDADRQSSACHWI